MRYLVPPVLTGLGLAIMEVAFQSELHFFPAPLLVQLIGKAVSPWFLGMLIVTIGSYLFALVKIRVSTKSLIAYVINTLAWEDLWYWIIRWHMPYTWNFQFLGIEIPYIVYHGIPLLTVVGFIISYTILIREWVQSKSTLGNRLSF